MDPNILLGVAAIVFLIWLVIVLPAQMASRRGRSVIGWILISVIFSPLLAIVLLAVLGPANKPAYT